MKIRRPIVASDQSYLALSAAVSADGENTDAAKPLIKFIPAPSAVPVLKTKGMEPG
jgi:hypothetical protein